MKNKKKLVGLIGVTTAVAVVAPIPFSDEGAQAAYKNLGDYAVGSTIPIKEGGVERDFVVLKHDSINKTTLLTLKTPISKHFWANSGNRSNLYPDSRINSDFNGIGFLDKLEVNIQNSIVEHDWDYGYYDTREENGNTYYIKTSTALFKAKIGLLDIQEFVKYKKYLNFYRLETEMEVSLSPVANSSYLYGLRILSDGNGEGFGGTYRPFAYVSTSDAPVVRPAFYMKSNTVFNNGSVVVDNTAPTLTVTEQSAWGKTSSISVQAVDDKTGVRVLKYAKGSYSTSNFPSGTNITGGKFSASTNGVYTIYTEDVAGNASVKQINVTKADSLAPTLTLTPSITAPTNKNVDITVSGSDGQSGLSVIKWAPGKQSATYFATGGQTINNGSKFTVSENGTYTGYAKDNVGNETIQHITISNLDKVAPNIPTFSPSTTAPTNTDVSLTINYSSDSAVKLYKNGEGEWTPYTGPISISANTTVFAKAADAVGNTTSEVSYIISNIDKVLPTISVTANGAETPAKSHETTINASDNVGLQSLFYQWSESDTANDNSWVAATANSSVTTPPDATGKFYLHVKAIDMAANETIFVTESFNVDNTPPSQPTITPSETAPTKENVMLTVDFSSDSFVQEVKIGEGAWEAYTAPLVIEENLTVQARAFDEAGNESVHTSYNLVNIDKTPPALPTFKTNTTEWTNGNVLVDITYSDDTALAEYSLDNQATWHEYDGTLTIEHNQSIFARATDAVGNTSEITELKVGNIDKEAPQVARANYAINGNKLSFVAGADNIGQATVQYQLNNGEWTTFTDELTLEDNTYSISMRSVDHVGNLSAVVTFTWRVYYQALQQAIAAVEEAESLITQNAINFAHTLVQAMGEVAESADLLTRLQAVQVLVDDNNLAAEIRTTIDAIEYAIFTQTDINSIQDKVDNLLEGARKDQFNAEVTELQAELDARIAVEQAEEFLTQDYKDTAVALVDALNDSSRITTYKERLQAVQQIIDYNNLLQAVWALVELAERNLSQADHDAAKQALDMANLTEEHKALLQSRLDDVQMQINELAQITLIENLFKALEVNQAYEQSDLDTIATEIAKLMSENKKTEFTQELAEWQKKYDYRLYKESVETAVSLAENTLTQVDHDSAKTLVKGLAEEDQAPFDDRLTIVQGLIDFALAENAVTQVEKTYSEDDYTFAKSLVDSLHEMDSHYDKQELIERLAIIEQVINAQKAVENVEGTLKQEDLDNARTLVDGLQEGEKKNELLDKLDNIQNVIDEISANEQLAKAQAALDKARDSLLQPDLDEANELIKDLADGSSKTALQDQADIIQKLIEERIAYEQAVEKATAAVKKAEKSRLQTDLDDAQKLVSALKEGEQQESLQKRLDQLQKELDGQNNAGGSGGNTPEPKPEPPTDEKPTSKFEIETEPLENGEVKIHISSPDEEIAFDEHVQILIESDKVSLVVGDETYESATSETITNLDNMRVVRESEEGTLSTVPHEITDNHITVTTKEVEGLVLTSSPASTFTDIQSFYSKNEIELLNRYLIVNGTTSTTYSPNQVLTRGHFSSMVARALELKPTSEEYTFKDTVNAWYANDVQALYEAGIIEGYKDGTFGGKDTLTRQQAAAMLERMLNYMKVDTTADGAIDFKDEERIADYAKNAVQYLSQQDVIDSGEDVTFKPKDTLKRGQMAKMLMRSLQLSDWY